MTVKQSISFLPVWELWINNFLYTVVLMWLTSQWKIFASQSMKITDDQLLGIIGSIGALSNGIGRFLWGLFYDMTKSFRLSMGLQTAICTIFVLTLPYITSANNVEWMFTIWMIILWFCAGCEYAFLPSCIAETFGAKHTGAIIGVFVMAEPPAMLIIVLLSSVGYLQNNFMVYCMIIGICCGLSTVLSILYKTNRIDRKSILKQSFHKMKKYDAIENL